LDEPIPSDPHRLPTRELVEELAADVSLLVRRQLELAQVEVRAEVRRRRSMAELLGAAGLLVWTGATLILVMVALAIGEALDGRYWLGALIVGAVLLVAAAVLAPAGWAKRGEKPLARSRRGLEKEIAWAKHRMTTS
jgi:hypothetical protein